LGVPDKLDGRVGGWVVEIQGDGLSPRRRYLVGLSGRRQAEKAVQDMLEPHAVIVATSPVAPAVLEASKVGPGKVKAL
jgi:hypothetical protein